MSSKENMEKYDAKRAEILKQFKGARTKLWVISLIIIAVALVAAYVVFVHLAIGGFPLFICAALLIVGAGMMATFNKEKVYISAQKAQLDKLENDSSFSGFGQ